MSDKVVQDDFAPAAACRPSPDRATRNPPGDMKRPVSKAFSRLLLSPEKHPLTGDTEGLIFLGFLSPGEYHVLRTCCRFRATTPSGPHRL
jgi:hypothetical protein